MGIVAEGRDPPAPAGRQRKLASRGNWPSGSENGSGWAGSEEEEREQTPGEKEKQGMDGQQEATPEKDSFGLRLPQTARDVATHG